MFPTLFEVFGVPIHAYGAFFALSYLAAFLLLRGAGPRFGLESGIAADLAFWGLVSGLVGARAFYAGLHFQDFRSDPAMLFRIWNGGLVFYGGLIGAALTLVLWGRVHSIDWRRTLDLASIAISGAQAVGRVGCFFAGCCHGSVCDLPWAVRLHSDLVTESLRGIGIHPVQLYEAGCLSILTLFLWRISKRSPHKGIISAAYLCGYSLIRFFTEIFRGDTGRGLWWNDLVSTSQIVSVAMFLGGLVLYFTSPARRQV